MSSKGAPFQTTFFILLSFYFLASSHEVKLDCSIGSSSCESCHVAYPFCYWCDSKPNGQQCLRYYDNFVDVECPNNNWRYKSCENRKSQERTKLENIYNVLLELRNKGKTTYGDRQETGQKLNRKGADYFSNYLGSERVSEVKHPKRTLKERLSDLKLRKVRLLKAIKLLRIIETLEEKQKARELKSAGKQGEAENGSNELNAVGNEKQSKKLINKNSQLVEKLSSHDLDELMNAIGLHSTKASALSTSSTERSYQPPSITNSTLKMSSVTSKPTRTLTKITPSTARAFLKRTMNVNNNLESSEEVVLMKTLTSTTVPHLYPNCAVIVEEDRCNNNKSCSWCNIMDTCMNRNEEDLRFCYSQSKRSSGGSFMVDQCLKHGECEPCVRDSKCFWCEKSKSCHVYPFFGYVPHNCPANKWYYKDCDVQLAIFIILFPLLIILIAMVIFYFCLRYCYYRKRTLKVPLFEKPGLIERRKGKKIYFMSGDEDDDELRTEQIRKKYKLPIEKEPLIAP